MLKQLLRVISVRILPFAIFIQIFYLIHWPSQNSYLWFVAVTKAYDNLMDADFRIPYLKSTAGAKSQFKTASNAQTTFSYS